MDNMTMERLTMLLKERGAKLQLRWLSLRSVFEASLVVRSDEAVVTVTGTGGTIALAVAEALKGGLS